jgi:mono/diheme cytochrome c family protein
MRKISAQPCRPGRDGTALLAARWVAVAAAAAAAALLTPAAPIGRTASAQNAASERPGAAAATPDPYQRSLQVYQFGRAAGSGPERGQEIFYYKCWFCHNEFTKDIPKLTGLYRRTAMLSGVPVSDAAVKDTIRNGSPGMAAYKYTLSEADLDDLVSYLRERCCWNSDAPPTNPRYRAR